MCLVNYSTVPAHQQPITVFVCEGGRVVTGGQDHVVKVLKVETGVGVFTFHGHYGPITAMFIDALAPDFACTASQDGMLCMWDLSNGTQF
jgi:WD40 repeat protein